MNSTDFTFANPAALNWIWAVVVLAVLVAVVGQAVAGQQAVVSAVLQPEKPSKSGSRGAWISRHSPAPVSVPVPAAAATTTTTTTTIETMTIAPPWQPLVARCSQQ